MKHPKERPASLIWMDRRWGCLGPLFAVDTLRSERCLGLLKRQREVKAEEPETRFQILNLLRLLFSALPATLAFASGMPLLGWVLVGYIVAGGFWFVLATWFVSPARQSGRLSFLPAALDVSVLSAVVYFTGGGLSTLMLASVTVTAMCSMNTRVNQGLFAAVLALAMFAGMNGAIWFGFLEPKNIMGPVRFLSGRETVTVVLLMGISNLAVHWLIRRLVLVLEHRNHSLTLADSQVRKQMAVARRIQEGLVPAKLPTDPSFRIETSYIPLEEVGGDFYDCFSDDSGDLGILVADAAGHGVPAALVASMSKIAGDASREFAAEPALFLRALNDSLLDRIDLHFVAATYAHYRRESRELVYCVAGNPAPFLLRSRRGARPLAGSGPVLGLSPGPRLLEQSVQLEQGDRVVFYTDGINECRHASGRALTEEQLQLLLSGLADLDPLENTALRIVRELETFTAGRGFEDDVTLLVLTVC